MSNNKAVINLYYSIEENQVQIEELAKIAPRWMMVKFFPGRGKFVKLNNTVNSLAVNKFIQEYLDRQKDACSTKTEDIPLTNLNKHIQVGN